MRKITIHVWHGDQYAGYITADFTDDNMTEEEVADYIRGIMKEAFGKSTAVTLRPEIREVKQDE